MPRVAVKDAKGKGGGGGPWNKGSYLSFLVRYIASFPPLLTLITVFHKCLHESFYTVDVLYASTRKLW